MSRNQCPYCKKPIKRGDIVCAICGRILPPDTQAPPDNPASTSDSGALVSGAILQGRYEIQRLIHSGGMGYVYSATDIRLRRQVIVKQIREKVKSGPHLEKLENEAFNMAKLNHSNVAMVLDHFTENNHYFLVVEFVQGKTLSDVFEEHTHNLSETEVAGWMLPVCDAVGYIHKQGLIHRDISPDNIMITNDGRIKLIDFGTLHELNLLAGGKSAKEGKFGFTPPEQWQGHPVLQSDVFAIGATIYYLLTGFLPVSDICRSGGKPQPPDFSPEFPPIRAHNSQVSLSLQAILQKALQLDPANRYFDAEQLQLALAGNVSTPIQPNGPPAQAETTAMQAGARPVLITNGTSIDFGYVLSGSQPPRSLTIRNIGTGRLTASLSVSAPWIQLSHNKLDTSAPKETITVTLNTSLLTLNQPATGYIEINDLDGTDRVTVKATVRDEPTSKFKAWMLAPGIVGLLLILGIAGNPVCNPPPILKTDMLPSYQFSNLKPGLEQSPSQSFNITNSGKGQLTGTITSNKHWLHVNPTNFNVTDSQQIVSFWVDTQGMDYKSFDLGTITVTSGNDTRITMVNLTITSNESYVYCNDAMLVGADEHPIVLRNNHAAHNPTWSELIVFLKDDQTDKHPFSHDKYNSADFAEELHNNAEGAGIRAAIVAIQLGNNATKNEEESHYCLNAFETTDLGIVYIDSTSSSQGFFADKIADVAVDRDYIPCEILSIAGRSQAWSNMGRVINIDIFQW